jgi:hypothetical protein
MTPTTRSRGKASTASLTARLACEASEYRPPHTVRSGEDGRCGHNSMTLTEAARIVATAALIVVALWAYCVLLFTVQP